MHPIHTGRARAVARTAASIVALALCCCAPAWVAPCAAQPVSPNAKAPGERTPAEAVYVAVTDDAFQELDALVAKLAASDARADDGRPELYMASRMIDDWYAALLEQSDRGLQEKYAGTLRYDPKLVNVPVLQAMNLRAMAWHARGYGYSSTVTPEGLKLYRERARAAWQILQRYRAQSSASPLWYQEAITIGLDADVPLETIRAIHDEGLKRFPGYLGIYFNFARVHSPRWGGSYDEAEAYVREQVAAPTNRDGDMLYTRLYWVVDQYSGADPGFFEESHVDWQRMRRGFELMMQRYPHSPRNLAYFVAYACRANDGGTYAKARRSVDRYEFQEAAPYGISLEVCDARFFRKT